MWCWWGGRGGGGNTGWWTRTSGVNPGEGYEYGLDMMTNMWVCYWSDMMTEKHITVILVRSQEDGEGGFTVYDASQVERVERFRPEDGVPMWRTLDENALEHGWHKWSYNIMRDRGKSWAVWSNSECYFQTTITGWKDVPRGGVCRQNEKAQNEKEVGCGVGKTKKRSGASGGSGARNKGTHGSWGKRRWGEWMGWRARQLGFMGRKEGTHGSWDSWDGKSTRGSGKQKYARQGRKKYASSKWERGW